MKFARRTPWLEHDSCRSHFSAILCSKDYSSFEISKHKSEEMKPQFKKKRLVLWKHAWQITLHVACRGGTTQQKQLPQNTQASRLWNRGKKQSYRIRKQKLEHSHNINEKLYEWKYWTLLSSVKDKTTDATTRNVTCSFRDRNLPRMEAFWFRHCDCYCQWSIYLVRGHKSW